jgi:6,7-dimethyl-8-ribityllumazine synthase
MAGKGTRAHADTLRIKAHVLIIESRYYDKVAEELVAGAIAELDAAGATYERLEVPGALEIPQALAAAVAAGLLPADAAGAKFDGVVALGCVIRGETSHYDIVCTQTNHWMMDVAIRAGVPLGNAVLTVENEAQAMARAKGGRAGKGADAVKACLSLVAHTRAFEEIDE